MPPKKSDKNLGTQESLVLQSEFIAYERICNQANSSARRAGILSKEVYQEAVLDPSTIRTERGVLAIIDVAHGQGLGYDVGRARSLATPSEVVSILAVPIGDLDQSLQAETVEAIAQSGSRALFFADNDGRDSTVLYEGLRDHGVDFVEIPLLDERSRPNHQQASLSLYSIDVLPYPRSGETDERRTLRDIQEYFDQHMLPVIDDPANASMIRPGNSFSDSELDEMWKLYLDRFQFLGQQHPISMEDSKDDFLNLLTQPETTVSIRYLQGKPICFTYFLEDFEKLYWLNLSYIQTNLEDADPSQMPVFFPGIVASKDSKGHNASEVITVFADAVARVGAGCRIYFENTNFSEQYIPKMVYRAASGREEYTLAEPTKIDQTDYRLVQIHASQA